MLKSERKNFNEMEIRCKGLSCSFKIMCCFSFLSHKFLRNLQIQKNGSLIKFIKTIGIVCFIANRKRKVWIKIRLLDFC
jgi:hypothetical protein